MQFVEVMACPFGCVNGGGQLKPEGIKSSGSVNKELVGLVERTYQGVGAIGGWEGPEENVAVGRLYE